MSSTRVFATICAAVAMGAATTASAQSPDKRTEYPSRPVSLVLPFPPGAATDAVARIMAPRLADATRQQWIIDNRAGAAGNIAAEFVAKAAPDGYTILLGFSTVLTVNKSLYPSTTFDPLKDFVPITQTATSMYKLVVHPSLPARSVNELVALATARAGELNYASGGVGTPLHLAAELFKSRARVNIVHVPYKGGGPAAIAVLSGESQLIFTGIANSIEHIKAGRLRALAVTGLKRSVLAPELPTMHESGFPGFDVTSWHSLLAPAGTPAAISKRVHDETIKVLRIPEVVTLMVRVGYEPTGTTADALAALIRTESMLWAKVIKDANIRGE